MTLSKGFVLNYYRKPFIFIIDHKKYISLYDLRKSRRISGDFGEEKMGNKNHFQGPQDDSVGKDPCCQT